MLQSLLVVLAAYLIGAVPVAYLTGRALRGVDIRTVGSGNLGPSNIWQSVSRPATVPVGLAEIAQGAAGILIAKAAGEGHGVQVLAGIASLAAHNWCPFLRLAGGRGVGYAIGFMAVLSWPALGAFSGLALVGVALRAVPQLVALGLVTGPVWALVAGQRPEIVAGLGGVAGLVLLKRVLGNDASALFRDQAGEVLANRLLYDRDTREREAWVRRPAAGRR
jgi:glycerol-3-phosphate acyltransferase PlsY